MSNTPTIKPFTYDYTGIEAWENEELDHRGVEADGLLEFIKDIKRLVAEYEEKYGEIEIFTVEQER